MSPKGIRWWLLCEDKTHERFAYSVARALGLNDRPIDVRLCERGAGSASVIRAYAQLVRTTVRKRPRERLAVLVLVDGDNVGVKARHESLDQALLEQQTHARAADEPIVVLVPTWSIETWLLGRHERLTEAAPLKHLLPHPLRTHFDAAAERLVRLRDDEPLPSLRAGHDELKRLPE